MKPVLARLLREGKLQCPGCLSRSLADRASGIACSSCDRLWPVRHGAADFVAQYEAADRPLGIPTENSKDFCKHLLKRLSLPDECGPAVADVLARAAELACTDPSLTAEIQDLMDRFEFVPAAPAERPPLGSGERGEGFRAQDARNTSRLAVEFVRHYLPSSWAPDTHTTVNVRLKNAGDVTWVSTGDTPLYLSYHWVDPTSGKVFAEGLRTRFPVPIEPGRALTLPLRVLTPTERGTYILRVRLVHEYVRWVEPSLDLRIAVINEAGRDLPEIPRFPGQASYGEDHQVGVRMIAEHIGRLHPSRQLILEVGSGTQPHTAWLDNADVIALDISAPLCELGSMFFEARSRQNVCFVCADAMRVPFAQGSFDSVVMFSALHHFPEPDRLLAYLKRYVKPGGFLALGCEPVGDNIEGIDTVRDLQKGINEQVFSESEYFAMFRSAQLEVISVRRDGGSIKAILR